MTASSTFVLPETVVRQRQAPVCLSVHGVGDWPRVASLWQDVAGNSPYQSFYLSSDWTACWLETFGASLHPQILLFEHQSRPVGVCLLVQTRERRGPFPISRIYLNTASGGATTRPMMECNNLLCLPGWEQKVAAALGAHLRSLPWDEFIVEGICDGPVLANLQCACLPEFQASIKILPGFYVDLERLRDSGIGYEDSLSSNTREQLRRSLRRYGAFGDVRIELATDLSTAARFFEELRSLHRATWQQRGQTGALDPQLTFHHALIQRCFARGAIHLLRVSAGDQTIGILYNFAQEGRIYFFQSGFNYSLDRTLQPGLVTHARAIRHYLDAGFSCYDFLAGDARYKRSLAKDCRNLAWAVFTRPSVKLAFVELLRTVKRRVNGIAAPS